MVIAVKGVRPMSFVRTHWYDAAFVFGIALIVYAAVAGRRFLSFLRDLFHSPNGS
jgi:hypothetical protein